MMMYLPRAASILPARAAPYPRTGAFTARAFKFSAISTEPSVLPLSATMIFARNSMLVQKKLRLLDAGTQRARLVRTGHQNGQFRFDRLLVPNRTNYWCFVNH